MYMKIQTFMTHTHTDTVQTFIFSHTHTHTHTHILLDPISTIMLWSDEQPLQRNHIMGECTLKVLAEKAFAENNPVHYSESWLTTLASLNGVYLFGPNSY